MSLRIPVLGFAALRVVFSALVAVLATACFESKTIECSGGVVCAEGTFCTADGLGCTTTGCGNGNVDAGEECDDGDQSNDDDCRNDCQDAICGDGFVDSQGPVTEDCDDEGLDTGR